VQLGWSNVRVAGSCFSLQPGHYSSLTAPYLQHTTNQERYDQCGNQQHSRAPDDGNINVRSMLSL